MRTAMDRDGQTGRNHLPKHLPLLVLGFAAGCFSSCALLKSGQHVRRLPGPPAVEQVVTRSCKPSDYPFETTIDFLSRTDAHFEKALVERNPNSPVAKAMARLCEAIVIPVVLPFPLVVDAILMPYTLPAGFFSSVCEETVVDRPVPVHPPKQETPVNLAEDVDDPPLSRMRTNPDAYAVVIGVEHYRDVPEVEFAGRDAEAVHAYLTKAMGFDRKNVVLLKDGRANKADLSTYLGPWLKNRVTEKSRVFVYFAGHGAPDPATGKSYLIPFDGDPSYTTTSAYSLQQLYDGLARLPSKDVTVVLDACFSGRGNRSLLAKGMRPLVAVKESAVGDNTVSISAADQVSTYYPEGGHGLLTFFMLKGLRGAADAANDGRITTAELFRYLQPEVERVARLRNVAQRPVVSPALEEIGKRGDRVLMVLKRD